MKNLTLSLLCLIAFAQSYAQPFNWAKRIGDLTGEVIVDMTTDAAGNVYSVGQFEGTVDFDPGAGTFYMVAAGTHPNGFVCKLDASGNFVWAKKIEYASTCKSITLDNSGNIYLTGYFLGSYTDFDPGPATYTLNAVGSYDAFVTKWDASGNFIWAKQLGGINQDDGTQIVLDASGNIYCAGTFNGTADFDPGPGTYTLSTGHATANTDIFLCKLNASGNFVWAKQVTRSGNNTEYCTGLAIDGAGNVLIGGNFGGVGDFDPDLVINNNINASGGYDMFVTKLNSSGILVWVKTIGGTGNDYCNGMRLNASGNIYMTGTFIGTVDFDPDAGVTPLSYPSGSSYVLSLTGAGAFTWVKAIGGTSRAIDLDASGNILLTGVFKGTADFDPGAATFSLSTSYPSYNDAFVAKLDNSGSFIWAGQLGGDDNDSGAKIKAGLSNSMYVAGYFEYTADFDPGPSTYTLSASGSTDIFITKLTVGCIATPVSVSGSTLICQGVPTTYTASAVSGASSYSWLLPSGFTGSSSTNIITATANGASGTLSVTANAACGSSAVILVPVTVNPAPSVNVSTNKNPLCAGETAVLSASGAPSYMWSTGETTASIMVSPSTTTGFTVTGTSLSGCTKSTAFSQIVTICTGVAEAMPPGALKLYPNPTNGLFTIEAAAASRAVITNVFGQEIGTVELTSGQNSLELLHEPAGVYFIQVSDHQRDHVFKLIKE